MNKKDLVAKVAMDTGLSKVHAEATVDSLLDGIARTLKKGGSVSLVGFGSFKAVARKARTGRNPQTGATMRIPKRRVAKFSAGKALKDSLN